MSYRTIEVDVPGGSLHVGVWGDGPPVLGTQGITGTHMAWSSVAEALNGGVTLISPDLRGRGKNAALPGPFGMEAHARDSVAVLDHLGIDRVPIAGMSMGGYVATIMGSKFPERVESILLIDGGIVLPVPPGVSADDLLEIVLGPSFERLRMTFESQEAYFDFWRAHPAFAEEGAWNEHVEAFAADDLVGEPPKLRSSTSEEAVREDGRDLLTNPQNREALGRLNCPVHLIRSPRDLQNNPNPAIADFLVEEARKECPRLTDEMTDDNNHYTLVTGKSGRDLIASRIMEMTRNG